MGHPPPAPIKTSRTSPESAAGGSRRTEGEEGGYVVLFERGKAFVFCTPDTIVLRNWPYAARGKAVSGLFARLNLCVLRGGTEERVVRCLPDTGYNKANLYRNLYKFVD